MVNRIYPPELQLNKANTSDTEAPFLDLHLSISNGFVSSTIYDKRDDDVRARLGACKTGLSPPVFLYWPFQGGTSVVVPNCSCCLCLYFGSTIMLVTYFVNFR